MTTLRMTSDLRRELILSAAKRCFAHNGFAGTTTKSVAAAASISEGLLFKHFSSKSALYAEILSEECAADPAMHALLDREPSTATLVELVRGMVRHFLDVSGAPDHEEAQRLRLMAISHLNDGEFAGLMYQKFGGMIGSAFVASLAQAVTTGDAKDVGRAPLNLFWFAHHTVMMAALTRLPAIPCLAYGNAPDLDRQLCEFVLRGIGLRDDAIDRHATRDLTCDPAPAVKPENAESA
jgi:AcrR family transcriptional regulator